MAKLPEEYAKEKAQKLLERQERLAKKREEKAALQKLQESEENINAEAEKKAESKIKKEERFNKMIEDKKQKATKIEVVNDCKTVKKKELSSIEVEDTQQFKQYTKKDTKRKVCVEVEKKDKDGNVVMQDKVHTIRLSEKEKKYLNEQNKNIEQYFFKSGTIPRYNKYICSCCGKPKKIEEFYKCWSYINLGRADIGGQFHKPFCKECAKKLFFYHYYNTCEKNEELAMERWCCDTNTYWSLECYLNARRIYENNPTSVSIVTEYVGAVGRNRVSGLTYWDSPTIKERVFIQEDEIKDLSNKLVGEFKSPLDWDKEDIKVRKKIIKMLRYDPFINEKEEDRKGMYRNLELMIDESMSEDFVKLQAAIEIVRSFQRIKELREEEQQMKLDGATPKAISDVSSLRKKEMDQITQFSKDHGFAEAYRSKKAKGAGTLTGCMNEMREKFYEDGLVNYYNVKTCKEMQETAQMSIEAIFSQIGLNENEAWQMVATQSKRIMALDAEVLELKEKLRLKEIEIKSIQLTEKARKEGHLETNDIENEEENNTINESSFEENDIEINEIEDLFKNEFSSVSFEDDNAEEIEDIMEVEYEDVEFIEDEVGEDYGD